MTDSWMDGWREGESARTSERVRERETTDREKSESRERERERGILVCIRVLH